MLDVTGLHLRAALLRLIREFFWQAQFLEVDTPVRQPVLIPESTIRTLPAGSWFLQPSPEQCMKRLLARGCSAVFQICPCFRADERGSRHLEEFTMLEWYRSGDDYRAVMQDCQNLVRFVLDELATSKEFRPLLQESSLLAMPLHRPWEMMTVAEAFERHCPVSVEAALQNDQFDEMIVEYIEPGAGKDRPLFLYEYPAQCASLALLKKNDPTVAERFELYISGMELANGFSELTDPDEQRQRFAIEIDRIKESGAARMPERFLDDLAMVKKAAGVAFGIDRLLMLIMSAASIDEVVSFSPRDW